MADKKGIPALSSLRRAIQKVRFLLSFDATKWIVSSLRRRPEETRLASQKTAARLSFKVPPSLLDCTEDFYSVDSSSIISRTTSLSSPVSRTTSPGVETSRSTSSASSGYDINQKADEFIENFYRQLQMERQVSLKLRYLRENSWERTGSD